MRATLLGIFARRRKAYMILDESGNAILDVKGRVIVVYM